MGPATVYAELGGALLARLWRDRAVVELTARRDEIEGFESRLRARWADALDGLDLLRFHAQATGSACNKAERPNAVAQQDFLFDALAKLHARACRVASEIHALLRTGHAEGAHARWRTLHEIAVTMYFLRAHGQDAAEMYLLHSGARAHAAADTYQKHADALGSEPIPEADMTKLREARDALVQRFGAAYASEYGWANVVLNRKKTTFKDVEAAVEMDRWRPWYGLASEGQHAGSRALSYVPGVLGADEALLLAGPSNAGLADAGIGAAVSLAQATVAFLTSWTITKSQSKITATARYLCESTAILRLADRVEQDFLAAARQLDRDHDDVMASDPSSTA